MKNGWDRARETQFEIQPLLVQSKYASLKQKNINLLRYQDLKNTKFQTLVREIFVGRETELPEFKVKRDMSGCTLQKNV